MTTGAIIFINLGTIVSFIKYSSMFLGPYRPAPEQMKIDKCQQVAVLVLGLFCLAGGILGEQFILFLFNLNISVDRLGYLQKSIFFGLSVIAGFLIFKYFISVSPFFKKIREIELGFRGICVSIGVFFAVTLIVTGLLN